MEACPCCTSLMQMCMWELISNTEVLLHSIQYLPSRIHAMLLSEAALLIPRLGRSVKRSVLALVSHWPKEAFVVRDLLPEKRLHAILHSGTPSLLTMIMEGLLNLKSSSKLQLVDFTGVYAPSLFQLPILSLRKCDRDSERMLAAVRATYKRLMREAREEIANLEAVISWKLAELNESKMHFQFEGKGIIDVHTECHLNLSDWIGIDDEIVGLAVHENTPFRLKIKKLAVDNYHIRQAVLLKGFMDVLDPLALSNLVINGKRRGVNLVLWDMAEHFEQLTNLKMFGMGTSGLKVQSLCGNEPSADQIFGRASVIFSRWASLKEVYIVGVVMSGHVRKLLGSLSNPLNKIIFYSCSLQKEDIEYLAGSHHLSDLCDLGLEYNNLQDMGYLLCDIVNKTPKLHVLNLKETKLKPHEKLSLMYSLLNCYHLETLVLFEKEDALPQEAYETIVEVACLIDSLREFYIFPFDYKPFELFYKQSVDEAVEEILSINDRQNLEIFY